MRSGYLSIFAGGKKQARKEEGTHSARDPSWSEEAPHSFSHPYIVAHCILTFILFGASAAALIRKAGSLEG